MVDFKKIRLRTPEEREEELRQQELQREYEERKVELLHGLGESLSGWDGRFARGIQSQYRLNCGFLTSKQWAQVDRILTQQGMEP